MKKKVGLLLLSIIMLLSIGLAGCQGGIAQEIYDQTVEQFNKLKEQLNTTLEESQELRETKAEVESAYNKAQDKITELEGLVNSLKEEYELTGETPAETAEKIVAYYHETHIYDTYGLFVCSDMSAEIWNMLKAQGINALMAVGDPNRPAFDDIAQCGHAWVLAEVAPGEYLALETTGGYSVDRQTNGGYYRGWTFSTPADIKQYQELIIEYNTRVALRNELNDAANQALSQGNTAVYSKLVELRTDQETKLNNIKAELNSLSTKL